MILEVADIRIQPNQQTAFEEAVRRGMAETIAKADGYRSHEVRVGVQSPERYLFFIQWESIEAHLGFKQNNPLYPRWREIVGGFFAEAPAIEHFELVSKS